MHLRQQGFSIVEVIIGLLLICVVVFAGWTVWHTNTTNKGYLTIKQWGVQFKPADNSPPYSVYYKYSSTNSKGDYLSAGDLAIYSTKFLDLKNSNGEYCSGFAEIDGYYTPILILTRSTNSTFNANKYGQTIFKKVIGNYTYIVVPPSDEEPNPACSFLDGGNSETLGSPYVIDQNIVNQYRKISNQVFNSLGTLRPAKYGLSNYL